MKTFTYCFGIAIFILSAAIADDHHKYPKATDVKPNHDCSCKGYEAKAAECKWPEIIQKCNVTSEAYIHYKFWCDELNNFRDEKREGEIPDAYNRTLTCDSYKSLEERKKEKCGLKVEKSKTKRSLPPGAIPTASPIAPAADWTLTMTQVKDQGECGSCWAFASNGLCEWFLKNRMRRPLLLTTLSEQNLVDCDKSNSACDGGWPTKSLAFMNEKGVSSGMMYRYRMAQGYCHAPFPYRPIARCPKGIAENYPSGNDARLRQVLSRTPVVGAINALPGLYQYKNGIYTPQNCSSEINHAIMVIGYGTDPITQQKYWICRNSWGAGWGDKGNFKIDANTANQCGISTWFWYY
jgi:cathepsin L